MSLVAFEVRDYNDIAAAQEWFCLRQHRHSPGQAQSTSLRQQTPPFSTQTPWSCMGLPAAQLSSEHVPSIFYLPSPFS